MSVVMSLGSELSQRSSRGAEASRSLSDPLSYLKCLKKAVNILFMNQRHKLFFERPLKEQAEEYQICSIYSLFYLTPAECPRLIAVSFWSPVSIQILIPN